MPLDMPIIGEPSVSVEQAARWIADRALRNGSTYNELDIRSIVAAYQTVGSYGGVDWGLALAQMCHETGTLSSWWSARPRRNPAGIGVTGRKVAGTPDVPPLEGTWAWDGTQWCEGVSFSQWAYDAVIAHIGRLLAYARRDEEATAPQADLIQQALAFRRLPLSYRGVAPTVVGLNGRWAVPGTTYGQSLIRLVGEMRK